MKSIFPYVVFFLSHILHIIVISPVEYYSTVWKEPCWILLFMWLLRHWVATAVKCLIPGPFLNRLKSVQWICECLLVGNTFVFNFTLLDIYVCTILLIVASSGIFFYLICLYVCLPLSSSLFLLCNDVGYLGNTNTSDSVIAATYSRKKILSITEAMIRHSMFCTCAWWFL